MSSKVQRVRNTRLVAFSPCAAFAGLILLAMTSGCADSHSTPIADVASPVDAPPASPAADSAPQPALSADESKPAPKAEQSKPDAPPPAPKLSTPTADAPTSDAPLVDKTFDDIKFEMEKTDRFVRSMLTPEIEALDGKRIRIRGYILPTPQRRGIRNFVLVRDNKECCFGPGAALFDCIVVKMTPGRTAEFSIRPVTVEGSFHIEEFIGPGDRHLAIYEMRGETVR